MPNIRKVGFKVGPSFWGYNCSFSTMIQDGDFVRLKKERALEEPTSPRLGTCQRQYCFALANYTLFQKLVSSYSMKKKINF